MPELPTTPCPLRRRAQASRDDAEVLTGPRRTVADYFEPVVSAHPNSKPRGNCVMSTCCAGEGAEDEARTERHDWHHHCPVAARSTRADRAIDEGAHQRSRSRRPCSKHGRERFGLRVAIVASRGLTQSRTVRAKPPRSPACFGRASRQVTELPLPANDSCSGSSSVRDEGDRGQGLTRRSMNRLLVASCGQETERGAACRRRGVLDGRRPLASPAPRLLSLEA